MDRAARAPLTVTPWGTEAPRPPGAVESPHSVEPSGSAASIESAGSAEWPGADATRGSAVSTSAAASPPLGIGVGDRGETTIDELEELISGQQRALAQVWRDRSVSKTNLHLLMLLERFGTLTMSRLASLAMVSLPSLTGIVTRMEEHGLVERLRDGSDRRVVLVGATAKGQATIHELEALRREYLRRLLGAMSAGDRRLCYSAIRAMRRIAEDLDVETLPGPSETGAGGEPASRNERTAEPER